MKGVGRIYQQTFIDTYSKVAFAKLYDRKTPITAADLLNDRVVPFFDEKEVKLLRVLTDRGTELGSRPPTTRILFVSRLNGWPLHSPADASPASSRMQTHGSGPRWIAR
jgi:hypothetical protein